MRQRLRSIDVSLLAVLAVAALALWPFLSRPGLPRFTDAELHVYRLAELARLVSAGELYPRWAPNFYFGYGYPIFNYYAPLSYYAGLPIALLPWWDAVDGVRSVFMLSMLTGALGSFLFVRSHWGSPAGLVAAAAYSFAPYVLYIDPHARGDLAESLAIGLFPLALHTIDRLRAGTSWSWLIAAGLVAAVILSHNLLALVSFALLLAYVLWQCAGREESRTVCAVRLGALVAGVGLSTFFWLPVALEQNAVNLESLIGPGGHFDYRNHFLSPGQLLTPPSRLDWGASEPAFPLHLGFLQWLLAVGGAALILRNSVRARRRTVFFALVAAGLLVLMLPLSTPVWETLPLLPYLQFPWRLLGAMAPVLAILAGAGAGALADKVAGPLARRLPALLVALLVVASFPYLQVPPWPGDEWDTSAWGVLAQELQGRWLGTTSTADFVPATVDVIPGPTTQLLDGIRAGAHPDRVNRVTLPAGTTVRGESIRPLHTRYHVAATRAFPLRLFQFSFPGWQVRLDGEPIATEIGRPEGFLVVPLPAGEYFVDVELVATPTQRAAWLISGVSLLGVVATTLFLHSRGYRHSAVKASLERRAVAASRAVLAAVLLTGLLYVVLANAAWLHVHSTGFQAIPAQKDLFASFDGEIALIGLDGPDEARGGRALQVTLYWKAQRPITDSYQVFVHLNGPDGRVLGQSDKLNPGEFPTRRWPLDRYVRDQHRLLLPAELPPGSYTVSAGLWLQAEERRLPVLDSEGAPVSDVVTLGTVTVRE